MIVHSLFQCWKTLNFKPGTLNPLGIPDILIHNFFQQFERSRSILWRQKIIGDTSYGTRGHQRWKECYLSKYLLVRETTTG